MGVPAAADDQAGARHKGLGEALGEAPGLGLAGTTF